MGKVVDFEFREVEEMPEVLEFGVVYVSYRFGLAIHSCACGCGVSTVMPLGDGGWELIGETFSPSIGNQNFPCRSHYWIRDGKVVWA